MIAIRKSNLFASALLLLLTCGGVAAQPILRLPSVIGDHMVLQENTNAKIWGWAEPDNEVQIIPSWSQDTIRTKSTGDTKWLASIQTPPANDKAHTLTIKTQLKALPTCRKSSKSP